MFTRGVLSMLFFFAIQSPPPDVMPAPAKSAGLLDFQ
jgi:hypothetical protein